MLKRDEFEAALDEYYESRGWDKKTSKPSQEKLASLGLAFAWKDIRDL